MSCNHYLLSLIAHVRESTTACSKSGSVPFIVINNQDSCLRPSFMTFLCFLCATTFAPFIPACVQSLLFQVLTFQTIFSSYSDTIVILLCKSHDFHHPSSTSSNFPTPFTTIKMVGYTGENANRFSFSGAAAQLRGGSPTAADSSGSSSSGSPPRM